MSRITISVPEELAALLAHEARRLQTSVSEVVRRAVAAGMGLTDDRRRPLPIVALGRSGHRHTARDAEKILAREWARAGRR